MTVSEKIFNRYQDMANYYASKIWNESNLGLEKADLAQELKIRLFLAIKRYGVKWKEYQETGGNKPVPLEFYLKTTMVNKSRDMIKEINTIQNVRCDEYEFEYGTDAETIDVERTDIRIGCQSVSEIFQGKHKKIFKMFVLLEFDIDKVRSRFVGKEYLVDDTMEMLRNYLRESTSIVNNYEMFVEQNS